jgi:hypothetical protein
VSKKQKLLDKLRSKPVDFTWGEAESLMKACNFRLHKNNGSARMFLHEGTRTKVRLHEPHPEKVLKPYMVDVLLEGLKAAGEIQ